MALKNFKAYQLALRFYWECQKIKCAKHLQEQLLRAASSIALNLSEGSAKPTSKDRSKFYHIALGSLRECEAILDLAQVSNSSDIKKLVDQLGGYIYQLCKSQKLSSHD